MAMKHRRIRPRRHFGVVGKVNVIGLSEPIGIPFSDIPNPLRHVNSSKGGKEKNGRDLLIKLCVEKKAPDFFCVLDFTNWVNYFCSNNQSVKYVPHVSGRPLLR